MSGAIGTQPSNKWNECSTVRAPSAVIVNAVPRLVPPVAGRCVEPAVRCLDKAGVGVGAVEVALASGIDGLTRIGF
jgi:hypothetical protein